jgi:hypothetical protein
MRIHPAPAALTTAVPHYSGGATLTGTMILLALIVCAVVFTRRRR